MTHSKSGGALRHSSGLQKIWYMNSILALRAELAAAAPAAPRVCSCCGRTEPMAHRPVWMEDGSYCMCLECYEDSEILARTRGQRLCPKCHGASCPNCDSGFVEVLK
jgi:hypothetical protein